MKMNVLGRTGIKVSELCFGALPMGPLQKNMDVERCAEVVGLALKSGVNFIDTAQAYMTYVPIRLAMEKTGIRPVIASKSSKKTYEEMEQAVNEALSKLGVDYIDIFLLHAAREGVNTFEIFKDSLQCLVDMKAKGKIKAIGISTHNAAVAGIAADVEAIDVIFPIINKEGRGITGGTKDDMVSSIEKISNSGKGMYFMKALAGGNLINEYDEAMKYVRSLPGYSSIAVGMVAQEEVKYNVGYFSGEDLSSLPETAKALKKMLVVKGLCKGCGTCIKTCPNKAISLAVDNKAYIDPDRCLTCGYCVPLCPEFAIRVI